MGEEFMLSAEDGRPRTSAWQKYVEACEAARPWQVRDELWIAAHMEDMERVRRSGLEERFRRQAVAHRDDPSWQAIHQHVEATLGTRLMDRIALEGTVAYETAFAHSLSATFFRLCTVSWHLVRRYWWEGFRAVAVPAGKSHEGIVSYRRLALHAARYSFTAWNASRVYRRGMRERDRSRRTAEDGWPLLADVLGPRITEVRRSWQQGTRHPRQEPRSSTSHARKSSLSETRNAKLQESSPEGAAYVSPGREPLTACGALPLFRCRRMQMADRNRERVSRVGGLRHLIKVQQPRHHLLHLMLLRLAISHDR